jgi:hypothetical protein
MGLIYVNPEGPNGKPDAVAAVSRSARSEGDTDLAGSPCENGIAMLKRFKIIADRYRSRHRRFSLRFFLIAAIYNMELKAT